MILQLLILTVADWVNRHQQQVITYLKEENRVLTSKLPHGRLRLTDIERRRLAALAHPLGRTQLKDTATIAIPDTLMRWYKRLIADKFDGSKQRKKPGRPRVPEGHGLGHTVAAPNAGDGGRTDRPGLVAARGLALSGAPMAATPIAVTGWPARRLCNGARQPCIQAARRTRREAENPIRDRLTG